MAAYRIAALCLSTEQGQSGAHVRHRIKLVICCGLSSFALLAGCDDQSVASHIAAGKKHLEANNPNAAVISFKSALQVEPSAALARYLLGKALLAEGNPSAAATELQKAVELNHAKNEVVPELARALLKSGQFRKVTSTYEGTVLDSPRATADLKASIAGAWLAQGDRARAESSLAAALAADSKFPSALLLKARLTAAMGDLAAALLLVQDVLARNPQDAEGWFLKGELVLLSKGDESEAKDAYRAALSANRTYLPAHRAIISMGVRSGDLQAVEAQLDELRKTLPKHAYTVFAEAQLAFMKADYDRARQLVQAILKSAPDHSSALHLAGAVEFQNGSDLKSRNFLTKAVQNSPEDASARKLLARVELRLGQPGAALVALQPLLEAGVKDAAAAAIAGEAYIQQGDAAKAAQSFAKAVALEPTNPRFRTAAAMSQVARGDADKGIAELQAIATDDKGTVADLALISAHLSRGELAKALAAADAMVSKQASAVALFTRGQIHARMSAMEKSRVDFEKALALDQKFFPAVVALASIDVAEGKRDLARSRFEKLLKSDPTSFQASIALADLTAQAGGSLDQVAQILIDGIKASPDVSSLRVALVNAYLSKRVFTRALEVAQQASANFPGHPDIVEALGSAQLASGQAQQALSTYRQLATLRPRSAEPHLRIASAHSSMGDQVSAERSLRTALELDPKSEVAQRRLMQLTLAGNRPRDALAVAKDLQKKEPKEPAGYIFESDILLKLKDVRGAQAVLRNGLKLTGSSLVAQRLHAHLRAGASPQEAGRFAAEWERSNPSDTAFGFYMSSIAMGEGDVAQAEKRLRQVVKLQPRHAEALNNLAWLLAQRKEAEAVDLAQRANEIESSRPAFLDTLALSLAAVGQLDRALIVQRRAVDLAPDAPLLRLNLAKIALQANDKTLAKSHLEALARLGSKFDMQAEVKQLLTGL